MTDPGGSIHVGFLVPAYGSEIMGGAEYGARMIAEHLAAIGCRSTVWTTTAMRSIDWAPYYRPGTETLNGVEVNRFAASGRASDFASRCDALLGAPALAGRDDQERWVASQGPVSPDALEAAVASEADVVVLYPYLYWPTVQGSRQLRGRAVLQPAAHDEAPIYLPLYAEVFTNVGGLVFHSEAERRLVSRLFPATMTVPQATLGLGIDVGEGSAERARRELGLGDTPYVLCLGRLNHLKGTTMLAEWWAAYKSRHPGPLTLVFAGPVGDAPAAHDGIVVAGPVDDETKWGLLRGAEVLISPSAHESFSLVLLEAWAAGRPALVNGSCPPTVEHCRRSGGGLWFDGYGSFEAALERLVSDAALSGALGRAGRDYVERLYQWPVLAERYRSFLTSVAETASARRR